VEARARIQGAALNRYAEQAELVRQASGTTLPWAQWWTVVGTGQDPRVMLATLNGKMAGAGDAQIGGDRMTRAMNDLASLEARRLIENWQLAAHGKLASQQAIIDEESDRVIETARLVNRIEGDRRNAEIHEGVLKDRLRGMVRRLVNDYSSGIRLAEQQGELAESVRQSEDLIEEERIPEQYQQVFKRILDGEVPVFSYIRAIAELDLPLSDLTQSEVVSAIRANADNNPFLGELVKNRPLLTALSTLARRNAAQVDEIHLGWLRDTEQYRKIH
jgi:hypothetical protein